MRLSKQQSLEQFTYNNMYNRNNIKQWSYAYYLVLLLLEFQTSSVVECFRHGVHCSHCFNYFIFFLVLSLGFSESNVKFPIHNFILKSITDSRLISNDFDERDDDMYRKYVCSAKTYVVLHFILIILLRTHIHPNLVNPRQKATNERKKKKMKNF